MSALAAIFHRTGAPADEEHADRMLRTMRNYGEGAPRSHAHGPASVGAIQYFATPEARRADQPIVGAGGGRLGVFELRIDNRDELISKLGHAAAEDRPSDEDLAMWA